MANQIEPTPSSKPLALNRRQNVAKESQPQYLAAPSTYPFEGHDDAESGGAFLKQWRLLLHHKKAIFLSSVCGLLLGALIGIPMTPVFRARTSIEVLNMNENFLNMKQSDPVTTTDGSYDTSEEETQAKLLEGDALLKRVYAKLDPEDTKHYHKAVLASSGWRSWFHLKESTALTPREKLLAKATKTLDIRTTPRTRVLEISADSTDPQFAASFVNALIQEFIAQTMEARWNNSRHTSDWLGREIDDTRASLKKSEDELQSYARVSGLIFTDTDEETNVATEKLQQVQKALSAATSDRIQKQARFELAQKSPPDSLADILNDTGLQDIASKRNDAKRDLADLSAVYAPDYSKVKRATADLATLQQSFDKTKTDIVQRIGNDYQQAVRNEKLLANTYDAQAREVTGQDEKTIQYNILKREVDSNRQLYDTMLQQMKQASIASALRASNVRVVDPADMPDQPVFPNFKLNSLLGLLAGLVGSVVFVILRDRADRTLQQPGDAKLWTDIAELGTIPCASLSSGTNPYYRAEEHSIGIQSPQKVPRLPAVKPVELMTSQNAHSVVAEAFRSVLTSILFMGEDGHPPQVLVFTSAQPSDGKTTVVSNLAIATAEIRKRVLVIDADLRRPRMHKVFSLSNDQGLVDILSSKFDSDLVTQLIQPSGIEGLDILTAGLANQAAGHLLHSPNFSAVLDQVRAEYDMVLIDTPPMLQITDARVVGRLADAVILVARAGKTTRDALLAVRQRFDEDHIHVLGSVLNDWDPKRSPSAYYSYQHRNYYLRN